jgi:hypothetical protein
LAANRKVVISTEKGSSIIFRDYLFLPKNSLALTTLTEKQKIAIKNIEEYWTNRVRNFRNWKFQKHWSYKKESISSRLDRYTFKTLKGNNNSKSIQNFVRLFLRDKKFRKRFEIILWNQYEKDLVDPSMELLQYLDPTDNKQLLIEIFPYVVSGKINVIEKELISFYFTFINEFSISYAIRVGLIHFRDLKNQDPIEKEEVIAILNELISEFKKEREEELRLWCAKCDIALVKKGIALDCPEDGVFYECPSCNYRIVSFKKEDDFESEVSRS